MLPAPVLGEEGVEGAVVLDAEALVRRHLAVGHDAVLEAEQLPAGVADLAPGLAEVDGNDLAHFDDDFPILPSRGKDRREGKEFEAALSLG